MTYTTEAIACGLSDVATERGDAEGSPLERVRHLKRGTEYEVLGEAEAQVAVGDALVFGDAEIQSIRDGDMLTVYRCLKTGKLWTRLTDEFRDGRFETIAAAPSHPSEADRVGLGKMAARFEAKRIEAAGFADEQADNSSGPVGRIEQEYRTLARTWAEARDMALAAHEDALIARSWGRLSAALGTGEGTGGASATPESPDDLAYMSGTGASATPSPIPHPQAPNTLSEVEEAKALLEELNPLSGSPRTQAAYHRDRADLLEGSELSDIHFRRALAIEAALATLRASQEQDGEVPS